MNLARISFVFKNKGYPVDYAVAVFFILLWLAANKEFQSHLNTNIACCDNRQLGSKSQQLIGFKNITEKRMLISILVSSPIAVDVSQPPPSIQLLYTLILTRGSQLAPWVYEDFFIFSPKF